MEVLAQNKKAQAVEAVHYIGVRTTQLNNTFVVMDKPHLSTFLKQPVQQVLLDDSKQFYAKQHAGTSYCVLLSTVSQSVISVHLLFERLDNKFPHAIF